MVKIKKPNVFSVLMLISILTPTLFSQSPGGDVSGTGTVYLEKALNDLCCDLMDLIPVSAMLLVITAGVVYAIGQMFGAETRARANVWATSCLTGAVIGVIIAQVAPCVLGMIAGTGCLVCNCT